jgi:hypothetical protein
MTLSLLAVAAAIAACAMAAAASLVHSTHGVRAWREYVTAPSQFDLALAEVSFGAPARVAAAATSGPRRESPLRLELRGPAM